MCIRDSQWIYSLPNYYPLYRRNNNGELISQNGQDFILDYGGNNLQTVNGVRPAFSGENAYGAIINNQILNRNNYISLNGYLKFEILKNLNFNSQFTYENATVDNFRFDNNEFGAAATVDGRVSQSRNFFTTKNAIQTINYENTFGAHTIKADAIFETYEFEENFMNARGTGFLPNIKVLNGSTSPESVGGAINKERLLSMIGRINYSFNRKFILEASFRRDWSSKFSRETRWGSFFSTGSSWVLSNENFIKNIDWINNLKLKASYGELGNNRGIGFFPYMQVFETGFSQLSKPGILSLEFVDPNLSWEKTALTNIGVEFSFFENKINGSIEYYNKESIDLIYDKPLALSTGNEFVKTNVIGGQNVIHAAINAKVKRVIALSTDKAAAPINLYWSTKLVSYKLFIAANNYIGEHDVKFSVVRYGNVMGSRGSVIPFFIKQSPSGVLPITDVRMTRFMISLENGVELVWKAFNDMLGGEIYVKKIPSMNICDIARAISAKAKLKEVGIRPGENTAKYIEFVLIRLTTIGTIYLTFVALLPEFLLSRTSIPFYLGGTSLLIVVTVSMDTVSQAQSHLIAHRYSGLIKKSMLRGSRR